MYCSLMVCAKTVAFLTDPLKVDIFLLSSLYKGLFHENTE